MNITPASADASQEPKKITLPDIPALAVNARGASVLTTDGELKNISHERAQMLVHKKAALVCHGPYVRGRLENSDFTAFDVLELFAFTHPGRFAVPTPHGLSRALKLDLPQGFEDNPPALFEIARTLLQDLQTDSLRKKADPLKIAGVMGLQGKGWPWTPYIFEALGKNYEPAVPPEPRRALNIWRQLPEWAEESPEPPAGHHGVSDKEAQARLEKLLGPGAEHRPEQMNYTSRISLAFSPLQDEENPHVVLAEAGTGVGKTLGYLAPASVWAEKNKGTVWISTYTKNLQRQIDQELDRLYPAAEVKDAHVSVRKGRENYLCLLNLEEAAAGAATARTPAQAIAAGIMARWAAATKDGDLTGGSFPGWLAGILGYRHSLGLADRRGECIYSACDHYHKCFVEKSVRKAQRARLVVANHALAMINAALSAPGTDMPSRYIFDEGHHLFQAADSAFAAHLTTRETSDLRRWILGAEGGRRSRARGLKRRAEDLCTGDTEAEKLLHDITGAAMCLTSYGWRARFKDGNPKGPAEAFLYLVYKQVFSRTKGRHGPYSLETGSFPLLEGLAQNAAGLEKDLKKLQTPMQKLAALFRKKIAADDGMLESDTRRRLDAVATSLERRALMTIRAWRDMLATLQNPGRHSDGAPKGRLHEQDDGGENVPFVDWMEIERINGRTIDVGLYRHHIDPMKPFAASIKPHLHGMAVTSATLRDQSENWDSARLRSGAAYLTAKPDIAGFDSPFDFAEQTRIFIINDVRKDTLDQVAGAFRALFSAAGGGALGLFTAISRLKAVHQEIVRPLEEKGLSLYSQHVDEIDPGTLVDMFREDTHACLLGTDAVRDGVDVPGQSLRLIVFDRVPWPRPTILHKARREAFGGRKYDEMLTRLKLKQAFGRLIRRREDKGVFVMLDPMLPSRLQNAFPAETRIEKTGLKDAAGKIREFLA